MALTCLKVEWGGTRPSRLWRGFDPPSFLADLESCVCYIGETLGGPLAARRMYLAARKKVEGLKVLPAVASGCVSPSTGSKRYKISYGKYDIYYSVDEEGLRVVVLGIKHQLRCS